MVLFGLSYNGFCASLESGKVYLLLKMPEL